MKLKLDKEEQELLESFESGEWVRVANPEPTRETAFNAGAVTERTAPTWQESCSPLAWSKALYRLRAGKARRKNRLTVFAVKPYNLDRPDRFQ